MHHKIACGAALTVATLGSGILWTGPVHAAQSATTVTCAGHELLIRTSNNNSSDKGGWSTVQVEDGGSGHLTPLAFSGELIDTSVNVSLGTFDNAKGNGHAAADKETSRCTNDIAGTVGTFVQDPSTLPPGAHLADGAVLRLTATVTVKT